MHLSVKDSAQLLGVSEKTIYRWIRKEEIPFFRVNDQADHLVPLCYCRIGRSSLQ